MRRLPFLYIVVTTLFSLSFLTQITAQDSTKVTEGTVKVEVSENIKRLIAKKRHYNRTKKYAKGYKIQLFYGSEQGAINVKTKFESVFTETRAGLDFDTPYWKVIVGNYKTRLEADRALLEIKDGFTSAIIIPAKVRI